MKNEQMELGLNNRGCPRTGFRQARRVSRARWWFEQMHRAVDEALEWPAPAMASRAATAERGMEGKVEEQLL